MKYFLFECKKMIKKKSIWAAMILSVIAIAGFYFFNYSVAERVHKFRMLDLENSQIDYPERIAQDRIEMEKAQEAGDYSKVEDLQRMIAVYERMIEEKRLNGITLWRAIGQLFRKRSMKC